MRTFHGANSMCASETVDGNRTAGMYLVIHQIIDVIDLSLQLLRVQVYVVAARQ